MTSDQIAELRKLNEQRTPGEWLVEAGDDECCSSISGIIGEVEKRRLEADTRIHRGDFPEDTQWIAVDPGCSPVMVVDNFDFIAALANACPELLDLAERGLEAEAERDRLTKSCEAKRAALNVLENLRPSIFHQRNRGANWQDENSSWESSLREALNAAADANEDDCGGRITDLEVQALTLQSQLAAVTAERDELSNLADKAVEMLEAWDRAEFGSQHHAITGVLAAAVPIRKARRLAQGDAK